MAGLDEHTGAVGGGDMVVVGAVVYRRLPVHRLQPLDRAEGLRAAVPAIEGHIQIPAGISAVRLQSRGLLVPGGEDDPGIRVDPGLH